MNESINPIAKNSDNKDELNQAQADDMLKQTNNPQYRIGVEQVHPNSIRAIQPYQFKKGESGNVNGRPPKNVNLGKELSKIGHEIDDDVFNDDKDTNRTIVMRKIWSSAKFGDKDMIKLLVSMGGLE